MKWQQPTLSTLWLAIVLAVGTATPSAASAWKDSAHTARKHADAVASSGVAPAAMPSHLDLGKDPIRIRVIPEDAAASEAMEKAANDKSLVGATWALVLVTAVLAVVTGLLFLVTLLMGRDARISGRFQAEATQKALANAEHSLGVARATLQASHRPWLKFTSKPQGVPTDPRAAFYENGAFYVALQFEIENVGNAPAFNVAPSFELIPEVFPSDARTVLLGSQARLGQEHIQQATGMGNLQGGLTIFPGEKVPIRVSTSIPPDTLLAAFVKEQFMADVGAKTGFRWLQVDAVGGIYYRSGDGSPHQSGFAYGLGVVDGFIEGANIRIGVPIDSPSLTADKLVLHAKYWHGNLFMAD